MCQTLLEPFVSRTPLWKSWVVATWKALLFLGVILEWKQNDRQRSSPGQWFSKRKVSHHLHLMVNKMNIDFKASQLLQKKLTHANTWK